MKKTISQRNVEKLLRELQPAWREKNPLREAVDELEAEYGRKMDEFENSAPMKRLKAKLEAARRKYETDRDRRVEKLKKVRQEYYANGLTPEVSAKLANLVEEFNR